MASAKQTTKKSSDGNDRNPSATDAVELLKSNHRAVEDLFAQYEEASGKVQKTRLAQQICLELSIHTTIEEELLYPACRDTVDDDLVDEAYVEHDGAKVLIAELMEGTPEEPFFDAKVKVLSEMIKHHVMEEEQSDGLFAQAKRAGIDLNELGVEMAARKKELKASFNEKGLPVPVTRAAKGAKLERGQPLDG